jgi:hypothetical protein
MGIAWTGELLYGADWGEDIPEVFDELGDVSLEDLVLKDYDIDVPWTDVPDDDWLRENYPPKTSPYRSSYELWKDVNPKFVKRLKDYYSARKAILEEIDIPIEIEYAGTDGYHIYIPYVKGYKYSSYQSEIVRIPKLFSPSEAEMDKVAQFCRKYDLPWENPGWILTSSMG